MKKVAQKEIHKSSPQMVVLYEEVVEMDDHGGLGRRGSAAKALHTRRNNAAGSHSGDFVWDHCLPVLRMVGRKRRTSRPSMLSRCFFPSEWRLQEVILTVSITTVVARSRTSTKW